QTVVSAKPEKASGIGNDFVHAVTRQAVSGGVGSDRKLFGAVLRAGNKNEYGNGDHSLHGARYHTSFRAREAGVSMDPEACEASRLNKQNGGEGVSRRSPPLCFCGGGVRITKKAEFKIRTPPSVSCFIK